MFKPLTDPSLRQVFEACSRMQMIKDPRVLEIRAGGRAWGAWVMAPGLLVVDGAGLVDGLHLRLQFLSDPSTRNPNPGCWVQSALFLDGEFVVQVPSVFAGTTFTEYINLLREHAPLALEGIKDETDKKAD